MLYIEKCTCTGGSHKPPGTSLNLYLFRRRIESSSLAVLWASGLVCFLCLPSLFPLWLWEFWGPCGYPHSVRRSTLRQLSWERHFDVFPSCWCWRYWRNPKVRGRTSKLVSLSSGTWVFWSPRISVSDVPRANKVSAFYLWLPASSIWCAPSNLDGCLSGFQGTHRINFWNQLSSHYCCLVAIVS